MAYEYSPFSPEGIAMGGSKYVPGSPEAMVMNPRPRLAAGSSDMDAPRPLSTSTVSSNNAMLRAQQNKYPVTVGKQPTPVLDAVGKGLSMVLGIGDAEGARYNYPSAPPPQPRPFLPDVGAPNRGPGPNYPPPNRAASAQAARAAAAKTAGSTNTQLPDGSYGMYSRGAEQPVGPGLNAPPTPAAPVDPNAAWNDFVTNRLANMGVPNAANVTTQTPPAADKASGVAAINAGGNDPRLLNYGNDNTVVGQATGGSKKLNSFTGFGHAGSPGAAGSGNPYDGLRSHIMDIIAQHDQLNNDGTLTGALKAHGLRSYLSRLGPIAQSESQHQYQMGQIGVAQAHQKTVDALAYPQIQFGAAQVNAAAGGDLAAAGRLKRAESGQPLNTRQAVPAFGYTFNPDTQQMEWHGFEGKAPGQ